MAKGSPLMGTQSGKLGESVLYRAQGEQLQRAYIRRPADPRTSRQVFQRMFMATMGKALGGMSEIVNHSFEQVEHGSKSMQYFMKRNIAMFRNAAFFNYDSQVWDIPSMSFVIPRADGMTWNPYFISEGSLKPITKLNDFLLSGMADVDGLDDTSVTRRCLPWPTYWSEMGINGISMAYMVDVGLDYYQAKPGDFFTACFISANSDDILQGAGIFYSCRFHYVRFQVVLYGNAGNIKLGLIVSNVDGNNYNWPERIPNTQGYLTVPYVSDNKYYPYIDMASGDVNVSPGSSMGGGQKFIYQAPLVDGDVILAYCWIHSRPAGKKLLVSTQRMLLADNSGDVFDRNLSASDAYDEWVELKKIVGNSTEVLDGGAETPAL